MIRCKLLEVMGRRGVRFMARLSEETGINRRTLSQLAENRMIRYDAEVLDRLCAYFSCPLSDLIEYQAGELGSALPKAERAAPRRVYA